MLPDKASDAWVFRDGFEGSVGELVLCWRSASGDVVDVGNGEVGDFGLEHEADVFVEDGDGVRPSHREGDESAGSEGGLESGEVS